VENIVAEQKRHGKLFYRVRWKGYNAENDTWQSTQDLQNVPELLKAWKSRFMTPEAHVAVTSDTSQLSRLSIDRWIDQATLLFTSVMSSSRTTVNPHTLAMHHVIYSYVLSSAAPIQDGAKVVI
jgi:hypothetical protein